MNNKTTEAKSVKLTEMQEFALSFLVGKGKVNPSYMGSRWHFFKYGRYPRGASRDSFGTTSAAYKCLRKLSEMGLVEKHIERGRFTHETFSEIKTKSNVKTTAKNT